MGFVGAAFSWVGQISLPFGNLSWNDPVIQLLLTLIRALAVVAVALLAAGLGIVNIMLPIAWSLCVDIGGKHSGAISGAMNTAGQIGSLFSSVLFGYLVEWLGSYDRALLPLSAMLLVSGVLFATIDPADPVLKEAA